VWTMAVVLIVLWMLGLMTALRWVIFTHILLVIAIVAMLIQIEDDCSDYDSDRKRKRFLFKGQLIRQIHE